MAFFCSLLSLFTLLAFAPSLLCNKWMFLRLHIRESLKALMAMRLGSAWNCSVICRYFNGIRIHFIKWILNSCRDASWIQLELLVKQSYLKQMIPKQIRLDLLEHRPIFMSNFTRTSGLTSSMNIGQKAFWIQSVSAYCNASITQYLLTRGGQLISTEIYIFVWYVERFGRSDLGKELLRIIRSQPR